MTFILKKLRSIKGFTFVEMLCAILILVLAVAAMITEITFATKTYEDSVMTSQAQTLCSTVTNVISDELRYSTIQKSDGSFTSVNYGDNVKFEVDEEGHLILNETKLLSDKTYGELRVQLNELSYDGKVYKVKLVIVDSTSDKELMSNEFSVEPLTK